MNSKKDEYDFSSPARGKFFRKDAALDVPVYRDPDVRSYFAERVTAKGIEVRQLVNELRKRDIALIEAAQRGLITASFDAVWQRSALRRNHNR